MSVHFRDFLDPTKILNCLVPSESDENELLQPKTKYRVSGHVTHCHPFPMNINHLTRVTNNFSAFIFSSCIICHLIRQRFS